MFKLSPQFNEAAQVFQQPWGPAEEDGAAGQWAMTLRQPRPVTGGMTQLIALAFPREQAVGRFFAAAREQTRPE
jgi:hypothetical protein